MKQKNADKQRPQPNLSKSRSVSGVNSKVSPLNSLRQNTTIDKLPCESHYFQIAPISQNLDLYYRQKLNFYFTHELKQTRPYPIVLQQFIDVEYLPFFGCENQIQNFRKHKNKYRSSFYQQKSKASFDQIPKKDLLTAIPKHKYCQLCKVQFQQYQKHINENNHIRVLRASYGNDIINQFIEDYDEVKQNQKSRQQVIFLNKLINSLKESNSLFKAQLRNYAEDIKSYQV